MPTKSKEKSAAPARAPIQNGFSLISNKKLLKLYSTMLECRIFEERIGGLSKKNKTLRGYTVSSGQEASAAGVLLDLLHGDVVSAAPGDLIPSVARGVPVGELLAQVYAPAQADGALPGILPYLPNLAARIALATGVALANMTKKNNKIAVILADSETASLDAWHETLQFAGTHSLPIIYVCRNVTEDEDISSKTKNSEVPSIPVDGNDAVAVYRVAYESISRARQGRGPTVVECRTCRGSEDSILNMEKYLDRKGLFAADSKSKVTAAFNRKLDAAIKSSRASTASRG